MCRVFNSKQNSDEEEQEEAEENYEIPQWKPGVEYEPSVYEELKPSGHLIVEERRETNNNSSGRLADIRPPDDNEYEPIQSPVCSGLPQHDNI